MHIRSLRILLSIGLGLFVIGCLPIARTSTLTPSATSLPPAAPTTFPIQNTPSATPKLVIGQPSSDDDHRVSHLAFSPDGKTLLSQTGNIVNIWDSVTGQSIDQLASHTYFAESPDGRMLALGSCGKHDSGIPVCDQYKVSLWDRATRQPVGQPLELSFSGPTTPEVLFSPDGQTLAAMQSGITGSGLIQLFDVATRHPLVSPLGAQEQFSSMAFSPTGKLMALGTVTGIIYLWNLETQKVFFNLVSQKGFVRSVAFSPDGKTLAAVISGPIPINTPSIQIWDMDTQEPVCQPLTLQTATVNLMDLAFSPNSNLLASLDENGVIELWDVAACHQIGPLLTSPRAGTGGVTISIAFSPDGSLAAGNKDGTIILWNLAGIQNH